jgi:hypothetical protein
VCRPAAPRPSLVRPTARPRRSQAAQHCSNCGAAGAAGPGEETRRSGLLPPALPVCPALHADLPGRESLRIARRCACGRWGPRVYLCIATREPCQALQWWPRLPPPTKSPRPPLTTLPPCILTCSSATSCTPACTTPPAATSQRPAEAPRRSAACRRRSTLAPWGGGASTWLRYRRRTDSYRCQGVGVPVSGGDGMASSGVGAWDSSQQDATAHKQARRWLRPGGLSGRLAAGASHSRL